MSSASARVLRYARAWAAGPPPLEVREAIVRRTDGTEVPATLCRPERARGRLPAWIVLHGITRPGRAHTELVRFTRALSATGAVTLVPEVPEWRRLDLAPELAHPTIRASVAALRADPWVADERLGVVGFSFGAPHAVSSLAQPDLRDEIATAVGFGGYCDLDRTLRFMMCGTHEWQGRHHRLAPDPYGRWVVAANYLTRVPDHAHATDVADGLRALAAYAGDLGAPSWDPVYDDLKRTLMDRIAEDRRWIFAALAPPSTSPDAGAGHLPGLAEALSAAAREAAPALHPVAALAGVDRPVHLLHGRRDHLIPFSETLRLHAALGPAARARVTITSLFGHSARDRSPGPIATAAELPRFARALGSVLGSL